MEEGEKQAIRFNSNNSKMQNKVAGYSGFCKYSGLEIINGELPLGANLRYVKSV